MLDDLDAGREIASHAGDLLRRADVDGRLPTPVEDIVAAAELTEPRESLLSESALRGVPEHLAAKMRKLRRKADAVLDRKAREIHVNPRIPQDGRRRFKVLHEVTHDLLPWQRDTAYADDALTLSWSTRMRFEQEANQGSAELLFQRGLFAEMAREYRVGFGAILELAETFGASYHASFRRYVETSRTAMAGIVLEPSPCRVDPLGYRRTEAINSPAWTESYDPASSWPRVILGPPFDFVGEIDRLHDTPIRTTIFYPNLADEQTTLEVELWSNSYKVFVLMWVARRELLKRRRIVVPSS